MPVSDPAVDISSLTPEQKLRLIEELWDRLSDDEIPITEAQRQELERRLADLESNPDKVVPWDEVRRRLQDRIT